MTIGTYLVDHHDGQQVQKSREEKTVHVVLHIRADGLGKGVKQDLADHKCKNTEADVPQRPALLQRSNDQKSLHDNVDKEEDRGEDVDDHKKADGVLRVQAAPALECEQRNDEADSEHSQAADSQKPN